MIEGLFASRALHDTLALFFRYPLDPLYPRLIVRHTGHDIKSVLRELRRLEAIGIVTARGSSRRKDYALNEEFALYEELTALFGRGYSLPRIRS